MKKTQIEWAKEMLRTTGEVTRNGALSNYISRLGSIVYNLRKERWEIGEGYYRPNPNGGKDYVYPLISEPSTEIIGVSREEQMYV